MGRDYPNAKTSVFWDVEDFPNPNGGSFYDIIKSALEKEGYRGVVSIKAYGEKEPDENLDGVTDFILKSAKTTVFWDVVDFPNPKDGSFYEIVKSALEKEGYRGEVSIKAYGEKEPDHENLDGVTDFIPKRGKYARLNKMLVDIAFWALDHPHPHAEPANMMVIAKNMPEEETEFAGYISLMKTVNYNVLLVVARDWKPEEVPIPRASSLWFWENLVDGGEPLDPIELKRLLDRVKRETFASREFDEDDKTPCPICGN